MRITLKQGKLSILLISLLATLVPLSCENALEEDVFIDVASNNFFENDEDAIQAVNAIYAKLRADGSVTGQAGQQQGWGMFGMVKLPFSIISRYKQMNSLYNGQISMYLPILA